MSVDASNLGEQLRIRFNLATGYANLAYEFETTPLATARNRAELLTKAVDHATATLKLVIQNWPGAEGTQSTAPAYPSGEAAGFGPELDPRTKEQVRATLYPAVILLAGALDLRLAEAALRPSFISASWLHELATSQFSLETLDRLVSAREEITGIDLIDWIAPARALMSPRTAYNLACYWTSHERWSQALRELATATADVALTRWARHDPSLRALKENKPEDFVKLVPKGPSAQTGADKETENEAAAHWPVPQLKPGDVRLWVDSQEDLEHTLGGLGTGEHRLDWQARGAVVRKDQSGRGRLDIRVLRNASGAEIRAELVIDHRLVSTDGTSPHQLGITVFSEHVDLALKPERLSGWNDLVYLGERAFPNLPDPLPAPDPSLTIVTEVLSYRLD